MKAALYQLILGAAIMAASPAVAATPDSRKVHVVSGGQHLQSIAKRYGVSPEQLRKVNGLPTEAPLKIGQRLKIPAESERGDAQGRRGRSGAADDKPGASLAKPAPIPGAVAPIRHKVAAGETLGQIAQREGTTVEVLSAMNGLAKGRPLQVGQLLVLPSVAKSTKKSWYVYARPPKTKGFLDVSTHTSRFRGQGLGPDGRLRSDTVRALNNLLGAGGQRPAVPERLVRLLIEVSDTFGGRPIRLVSGYRTTSYFEDSRHKHSSAIDFLVVGVPNAVVCEYLREIEDVGVGYYPNSSFVHMDVRDHSAYWVDYAGPGEPPRSSPNAPPSRPSRPMRPADRRLLAELDRILEKTKRGLDEARPSATPGTVTTKPERQAPAGPRAPAQAASNAAFAELAMSVAMPDADQDADAGSKPAEP